jgi:hypothetical protein
MHWVLLASLVGMDSLSQALSGLLRHASWLLSLGGLQELRPRLKGCSQLWLHFPNITNPNCSTYGLRIVICLRDLFIA